MKFYSQGNSSHFMWALSSELNGFCNINNIFQGIRIRRERILASDPQSASYPQETLLKAMENAQINSQWLKCTDYENLLGKSHLQWIAHIQHHSGVANNLFSVSIRRPCYSHVFSMENSLETRLSITISTSHKFFWSPCYSLNFHIHRKCHAYSHIYLRFRSNWW